MPSEQHANAIDQDEIDEDAAQLQDGRNIDLMAEAWCDDCESHAVIDETAIDHDTMWVSSECDCGDTEVHARVAPWPRDYQLEEDDG